MDWTTNALVALYFAVERKKTNCEAVKFLVLNPHLLNQKTFLNINDELKKVNIILGPLRDYEKGDIKDVLGKWKLNEISRIYIEMNFKSISGSQAFYPLAIMPTPLDERMRSQQSRFTIFGNQVNGLLDLKKSSSDFFLESIEINPDKKLEIKKELQWLGVDHKTIYPGLEGIAKSIDNSYFEF